MLLRDLHYSLQRAFQSIRSGLLMHSLTIGTIAVSLLIFGAFLMLISNLNEIIERWGRGIQVTVFLEKGLPEAGARRLIDEISRFQEIKEVRYISEEEALERLEKELASQSVLLEGLEGNPLPASIEIELREGYQNRKGLLSVVKRLRGLSHVEDIKYGQQWVERFSNIINLIKISGLVIGGILLLAITFIISNTIKLTVYARREEIEIMKLVGATDRFIKAPFFMEGMLQGFLGGFIAIGVLYLGYGILNSSIHREAGITLLAFEIHFLPLEMAGGLVLGGIVIGLFGSFISLSRFLRF